MFISPNKLQSNTLYQKYIPHYVRLNLKREEIYSGMIVLLLRVDISNLYIINQIL